MRLKRSALLACCLTVGLGCSSGNGDSANQGGAPAESGGMHTGNANGGAPAASGGTVAQGGEHTAMGGTVATGSGGAHASGGSANGGSVNGGASPSSGGNGSGGQAGAGATPSDYCVEYCKCMSDNCPQQEIPGGVACFDFCATFTKDQQDCRKVMCVLVPDQPNNDHCRHAVGISQCT